MDSACCGQGQNIQAAELVSRLKLLLKELYSKTAPKNVAENEIISHDASDARSLPVESVTREHRDNCIDYNSVNGKTHSVQNQINVDGLTLEIDELFTIVQEYDQLREKCIKLEFDLNVGTSPDKILNNLDCNSNILSEKMNEIQSENQRLTTELKVSNKRLEDTKAVNIALENTIKRIESDLQKQKSETMDVMGKLSSHDAAANRAISVLQKEMEARVEEMKGKYQTLISEKDSHIVKIAKLEAMMHDLNQKYRQQQRISVELEAEVEQSRSSLKVKEADQANLMSLNERYEINITKLNKRIETLKEEIESYEIKIKWSQNKVKSELESHKETKKQLGTMTAKFHEVKEEGDQIRRNCQEMIERYQKDEEISSVSLRKQLEELKVNKKEVDNLYGLKNEENEEQMKHLNQKKAENIVLQEQLTDQKAAMIAIEEKNHELSCQVIEKEKDFAEMKSTIDVMKEQIKEFDTLKKQVEIYELKILQLKQQVSDLTSQLNESLNDIKHQKQQQNEILQYSKSLTQSDVNNKATLNELQEKLVQANSEKEESLMKFKESEQELLCKITLLENDKERLEENLQSITSQNEQKSITLIQLSKELGETQNDLKVTRRKNASQLKELQQELHKTTKKIEQLEGNSDCLSNHSRTSSCSSLDRIHVTDSPSVSTTHSSSSSPQMSHKHMTLPQDHYVAQPSRTNSVRGNGTNSFDIEIDKKVLVEKICRLQKLLAKKNEKLEFLEDHNIQLTDALQKKSKIIQQYFSKIEPGVIAPEKFDNVKANISQYGGIMSSVYSAKSTDTSMTLELSLTINSKLQAVLEDTVLKNITLQESLSTLGKEIAKFQEAGSSKPP